MLLPATQLNTDLKTQLSETFLTTLSTVGRRICRGSMPCNSNRCCERNRYRSRRSLIWNWVRFDTGGPEGRGSDDNDSDPELLDEVPLERPFKPFIPKIRSI